MPRIAIIAGEVSGDRLGAGLIAAARHIRPDLRFEGIAGPAMLAEGCSPWARSEELAVMGIAEVLRHLPRLRRIMADCEARILADPPDVFVGIDSPDFNLRVERVIRRAGVPTVHYVSPSVWAWREGRVGVLREACDHVLCLLPFEADFLNARGVSAEFVGHPLADELVGSPDRERARHELGIAGTGPVVAVLPGSRQGEIERLGPVFAAAAAWLAKRAGPVTFVAPMATPLLREAFAAQVHQFAGGCEMRLVDGRSHVVMAASDVVLLASGTATLEAMLLGRPMVVAYRISPLTFALLKWLRMVRVDHIALPNLLAGERLVPEFLQADARPESIGAAVLSLIESPGRRAALETRFAELNDVLRRGASKRAAGAVLRYV